MQIRVRQLLASFAIASISLAVSGCAGSVSSTFDSMAAKSGNNPIKNPVIPTSFTPNSISPPTRASQGVAFNGNQAAYVNAANYFAAYSANWVPSWYAYNPIAKLPSAVNHIGDIDYYNGNILAPAENYSGCQSFSAGSLAIYNASNGVLRTWSDIHAEGHEISSVTVVPEKNQVVVSSFCDVNKGFSTLWIYDLNAVLNNPPGTPLTAVGTITLSSPIQYIQGISWNSNLGVFMVSADIGIAGSLYYIAPDGTVSGPAYVVPGTQPSELEGIDISTGNIYFLEYGFVYGIGTPPAQPTFSPAPGTYKGSVFLSIADATPGAVIHYTLDGSVPTSASPVYSSEVKIKNNTTVSAIAFVDGKANSPMTVGIYK